MKDNIMELKILEHSDFGEIRTQVDDKGNILFAGSDVAKVLDYSKPANAVTNHCKGVTVLMTPTNGGVQKIKYITEGDLYRLIINSKLPSAEIFEKWVFDEVLPSLRKYGMYATDEVLADDEKLLEMAEKIKAEKSLVKIQKAKAKKLRKEKRELLANNKKLKFDNDVLERYMIKSQEVLDEVEPLVYFAESVLNSDLDMTATQIAADYGLSAYQLNIILNEVGLQRKVNNQWVLYKRFMNRGLTTSYTSYHEKNKHYFVQTLWTQRGRLLIHEILSDIGYELINTMEVM